jgi:hypothetical protein
MNPVLGDILPEMPHPLPPWNPPVEFSLDPPFVKLPGPPYPLPVPVSFEIATNIFIVIAEWGAETFWGPPGGPRPNEDIIISPIDALRLKRSGMSLADIL